MTRRKAKKPEKAPRPQPPPIPQPVAPIELTKEDRERYVKEIYDQFKCYGGIQSWSVVLKQDEEAWIEKLGGLGPFAENALQRALVMEENKKLMFEIALKKELPAKKRPWEWRDDISVDYVDLLDRKYIYKPKSFLTADELSNKLTRWRIAHQRNKMKKFVLYGEGKFTAKEYEKEDDHLEDLFDEFLEEFREPSLKQIKELEVLDYQFRVNSVATSSKNNSDGLLPKESVARQLLFEEIPTEKTLKFISENFTREEFRGFAKKLRALKKLNRVPIDPKKTNERRTISKRELLNDIALRVKQYSKTFEVLLLPYSNPWPHGISEMSFSSREIELIISICYSFSPRFDRTFEDSLKTFSYSELEDFSFKVDYRINAIVNDQACRNILPVKLSLYSENSSYDSQPFISTKKPIYRKLEEWEIVEREKLIKSITQRILKPKIREVTMFLLLLTITEKLTCEEKRFIAAVIDLEKEPDVGPTLCLDSLEWLRRFSKKLTIFENRLENDLKEVLIDGEITPVNLLCPPIIPTDRHHRDTDIFTACYPKIGSRQNLLFSPEWESLFQKRQFENKLLIRVLSTVWTQIKYDFTDPCRRYRFNVDFRTAIYNRSLVHVREEDVNTPQKLAAFYKKYINPTDGVNLNEFLSYEDVVLESVDPEKKEPDFVIEESIAKACMKIMYPIRHEDIPQYVNYDNYTVVHTKNGKLPTHLRTQSRHPIKRKIKKSDPIRLERKGKRSRFESCEIKKPRDWEGNQLRRLL